ncbi:MAG TPA: helix-turn-helix transcriptional regulator [Dokdonella sp.]
MSPEELQVRLGYVIRRHRESQQYSQEGFADTIGVHRTYYGDIERGKQNPSLWNLQRVALGLKLLLSQLVVEAEQLDLERASREPPSPPRRGRPRGSRSR